MALLGRLILALVLALHSLPVAAGARCARMDSGTGLGVPEPLAPDESVCPCCASGAGDASGCSEEGAGPACRCGTAQPEQPKAPPTESRPEVAPFVAVMPPGPCAAHPDRALGRAPFDRVASAPLRPGNSIQSLLCVWMM